MHAPGPGLQVGFFEVVVLPLFRAFVTIFPRAQPMLERVEDNYQMWRDLEIQAKLVSLSMDAS